MIIDVAEERLVVVSDLHLGNPASRAASSFRAFLDYVREEGFSLCLNGDVFEMLQTRFARLIRDALPLISQLSRLNREGRRVYYVIGNHDIYMEHFLDEWLVTGVCPFLNVTSGGKRIRVEHGHLYDPVFSRSPAFYESITRLGGYLLFARPALFRLKGFATRHSNRCDHARKSEGLLTYHAAASDVLRRGFDTVVYGHTHRPETTQLEGGLYVNSGEWMRGGDYVEIVDGHVELKQWAVG